MINEFINEDTIKKSIKDSLMETVNDIADEYAEMARERIKDEVCKCMFSIVDSISIDQHLEVEDSKLNLNINMRIKE